VGERFESLIEGGGTALSFIPLAYTLTMSLGL